MAFNVFALGKLKGRYTQFKADHPDVMPFLKSLVGDVKEGSKIQIKLTAADGTEKSNEFTLGRNDIATFEELKKLKK